MRGFKIIYVVAFALDWLLIAKADAFDECEFGPIQYRSSEPDNCISRLQARIDRRETSLAREAEQGYLRSLLNALRVPIESQTLVFSKTSFQRERISPIAPRALYFNEEVYIGYCQAGPALEIVAADLRLGLVFYTLPQQATGKPSFRRRVDECLVCHGSFGESAQPKLLARSVFVDAGGDFIHASARRDVDHTTPLAERWGGWYVTGEHGSQRHLGNLVFPDKRIPSEVGNNSGQNLTRLNDRFNVGKYLSPHSDIVSLMVLEHQTLVQNLLVKASFAARQTLDDPATTPGEQGDAQQARVERAANDLVDALLFVGEAELTAPIRGTSQFAERFARQGPRDRQGRSLRDFDLRERLFKYPCSYLIYSPAFDRLPQELREYVWRRLWRSLSSDGDSPAVARRSASDRRAIVEILRDTKPGLPDYWR